MNTIWHIKTSIKNIFKKQPRRFEKVSFQQYHQDFIKAYPHFESMSVETIEQIYNNIKLPKRGTRLSAGYDFFAPMSFVLEEDEEWLIPTGIRCIMRDQDFLALLPRSGHGFKYYARLANTLGVIDAEVI